MSRYKMVLTPGTVGLSVERPLTGTVLFAIRTAGVIGQTAIAVVMPGPTLPSNGDNAPRVKWCSHCSKYYNPDIPHDCPDSKVNQSRSKLEKFLGGFKIKE